MHLSGSGRPHTLLRWMGLIVAIAALSGASAESGMAAVCADYDNQRDAQIAADTRDADNDGIYCEALPCPCLRPGEGGGGGGGTTAPKPKPTKPRPKPAPYVPPREIVGVTITSVVDGEIVNARTRKGGYLRVKLLGVDSPEWYGDADNECGADETVGALEAFRADHSRVTLVTDPSRRRYDEDGNLQAYVEPKRSAGYSTYQTFLLSEGWSQVDGAKDFRRRTSFRNVRDEARANGKGVWTLCGGNFHLPPAV